MSRHGVFTASQATQLGVTRWLLRRNAEAGIVEQLEHGLFRIAGAPRSWEQRASAALLSNARSALMAHSAAYLWRLDGADSAPHLIELLVARSALNSRLRTKRQGLRVSGTRIPFEVHQIRGLRVTSLARTLLDLAARHGDDAWLENALDSAQRRHPTIATTLKNDLAEDQRGHSGAPALRALIDERTGGATDSALESKVHRRLRRSELPPPRLQHPVSDSFGHILRVDFAWPTEQVALHVDGYAFHQQRARFERDRAVNSRLAASGWASLWVTHHSFESGEWLTSLRHTLQQRSPQLTLGSGWA